MPPNNDILHHLPTPYTDLHPDQQRFNQNNKTWYRRQEVHLLQTCTVQSCVQKDREETLPILHLNLEYMYIPDNACSAFSRRERSRIKRLMRLWLKGSFFGKLLWCAPPPSEGFPGDTAELDTTATLEVFLLLPTITWLLLLDWTLGDIICSQRGVIGAIAITISASQSLSVCLSVCLSSDCLSRTTLRQARLIYVPKKKKNMMYNKAPMKERDKEEHQALKKGSRSVHKRAMLVT